MCFSEYLKSFGVMISFEDFTLLSMDILESMKDCEIGLPKEVSMDDIQYYYDICCTEDPRTFYKLLENSPNLLYYITSYIKENASLYLETYPEDFININFPQEFFKFHYEDLECIIVGVIAERLGSQGVEPMEFGESLRDNLLCCCIESDVVIAHHEIIQSFHDYLVSVEYSISEEIYFDFSEKLFALMCSSFLSRSFSYVASI